MINLYAIKRKLNMFHPHGSSPSQIFLKMHTLAYCFTKERRPSLVLFCELCKIFQKSYSAGYPWKSMSKNYNLNWLIKVGLSPSKKIPFLHWKPFRNDEKLCFFQLKSSSPFQDISIFVSKFCSCRKNSLIRNIRSFSKFMTSQLG